MATTTSYVDLGAVQRIETGSETAGADYVDLGAAQRPQGSVSGLVAIGSSGGFGGGIGTAAVGSAS
jgi:hypothetical protein